MIYPDNFEKKIGFDQVRELIAAKCLSALGKTKVDQMRFSASHDFILNLLTQTEEFRQICMFEDDFPVNDYIDVRKSLHKIRVEGTFLEVPELFGLKKSLEAIRAIVKFFLNREDEKYPALRKLSEPIFISPDILNRINGIINKHGAIRDNASAELLEIRNLIRQKENSVSRIMHSILKRAQTDGWVDADVNLSIREGRAVIPVQASNKRKIKGYVLDESATGKTVFIEPVEIIEVNNEIKELNYAEKREIIRILTEFTNEVRPSIDDLLYAYDYLGVIDFIRAKALFAIQIEAEKPILEKKRKIKFVDAKHPLLFLSLKKEGREVVPLNLSLHKSQRVLLISGPNAGGKSVCLKTTGLLQYMLQCGLLISASPNSELSVFKNIFIDIGDEQSIENDLSTYSSHLMNMKHFTKFSDPNSLVLIDEFGTGTEPLLGGAIAQAVLQKLNENKSFGVITTHYTNLKHYASSEEGISNGAMMFDTAKIEPMFQLQVGEPGSSFAFEIARKIGVSEEILANATNLVGEEHINFDKHLREIVRDKRYWENKRSKIKDSERKLDKVLDSYSSELDDIKELRREIIRKAKEDAQNIVKDANKKIEQTIREIKEANAEKEKTRFARKKFEDFREEALEQKSEEDLRIERKLKKLQDRDKSRPDKKTKSKADKRSVVKEEKKDLVVGDKVKMIGQNTAGEILEISGKNAVVAFGFLRSKVKLDKLQLISNKEYKKEQKQQSSFHIPKGFDVSDKKLSFKQEIDVRGKRAEEALQEITDFIDNAIMVGASEVRILHGKGNGILRQLIREYLHTVDVVGDYRDEHVQFGGSGITKVKFDY